MQYLAPATCLLMGLGMASLIERRPTPELRKKWRGGIVVALAALGLGQLLMDFVKPYRDKEDIMSRRFSQWLWNDYAKDSELICAHTDLGLRLDANPLKWQRGMTSIYRCYQALYSPRHRRHKNPDISRVSENHPLRIVFFDVLPEENPAFGQWLESLGREYTLKSQKEFVVFPPKTKESWKRDGCVVLEFVPRPSPRGSASTPTLAGRTDFFRGRF
jgi:hypothetical protein